MTGESAVKFNACFDGVLKGMAFVVMLKYLLVW